MVYRLDELPDGKINPFTGKKYDESWMVLQFTCSIEESALLGVGPEGVYSIRMSRMLNDKWYWSVGDFIEYCEDNHLNGIVILSEKEFQFAIEQYQDHSFIESQLRENESPVLIHSTTAFGWEKIQEDKMLKCWNRLKTEMEDWESEPIGKKLGDPSEFSNYIMFGGAISGEVVVNSRQSGFINMDVDMEYHTGARLYFDAKKIAEDGLLVRDGTHVKVREALPLEPYLICAVTWDKIGLDSPISTPQQFARKSDEYFRKHYKQYTE